jgi:hypothetical protein
VVRNDYFEMSDEAIENDANAANCPVTADLARRLDEYLNPPSGNINAAVIVIIDNIMAIEVGNVDPSDYPQDPCPMTLHQLAAVAYDWAVAIGELTSDGF